MEELTESGPPQFTMRLRDKRVQASYPVRLTCQAYGYPEPEIIWYKDDKVLKSDGKFFKFLKFST